MNRRPMAHRHSHLREFIDIVSFFGFLILAVLFFSLDGIR